MILLTIPDNGFILSLPLHSRDGIRNPHTGQKRPLSTVVFLCPSKIINKGLLPVKSFMVGCIEQPLKRLAVPLCGIANLIQSTAQDFAIKDGGLFLNKGHKPMLNHTQKPLTISVSTTKQNSLYKQADMIGYSLNSFCLNSDTNTLATLKADALELVRMLDELEQNTPRKTSLFNVLAKDTRQLIAEKVSFKQAKQYPDAIVKFSCMVGGVA